ncbi:type I restriction enzyme HsdR N-terminal domain-containing protein [Flavobacteriaceae bacterium]|nr:type I restriction enzyme HsdR N-terminal domain-containing protein [Flavobacteriaceae bacterium]MDC0592799.1 type I restriction enzyme HsdR N-terminal domain-containing protein [Flavobacteriaceae bacterium]
MITLNFPDFEFKLKKIDSKTFIFDFLRKKYFLLTPEEWVRQHVLNFLFVKKIPLSHIAVEKKINVNNLNKRFDVVVYNNIGDVLMLIECKSPSIKLTQEVFDQISVYNLNLNSNFCMITNGLDHIYFKIDQISKKYTFIKEFPLK